MAPWKPLAERIAASLKRQCEAFDLLHPVGSTVRCWKGERGDGPGYVGQVREPGAYVLSGHTAVVFVTGVSGCIALTHVEGARE